MCYFNEKSKCGSPDGAGVLAFRLPIARANARRMADAGRHSHAPSIKSIPAMGFILIGVVADDVSHFAVFVKRGIPEQGMGDGGLFGGGLNGCAENGIFDVSAAHFEVFGECEEIDVLGERGGRGNEASPKFDALCNVRHGKVDFELDAACKGFVEAAAEVCRQNGDAGIGFEALEQIVDFEIGVAVVGTFDVGAFGEERVGFVKEQHGL